MVNAQVENRELALILDYYKKYRKILLVLILFAAVFILGGNYWHQKKSVASNQASQIFQEMIMAEIGNDSQAATEKGAQLITKYAGTPYAQFAGLLLAKMAVQEGDLDKAAEKLRWVMDQQGARNLAGYLATVRLSAVLQQQGKLDEALALVDKDVDNAYLSIYAQARGDIYVAKGDIVQAKKEYQLALQSLPQGTQSPILQMKLLDLGADNEA